VALLANGAAGAMELDTGNSDVSVRWDNTVKYSAAARVKSQDPALLTNPNNDDGNRNFGKGLISSRFDLLSELDVVYQRSWGARISAAAWYDSVYNRSNDNPGFPGGAFPNQVSVPHNAFTRETRDIHGRNAEILDAFLFGKFDVDGRSASVRIGRHSLLWGESVFFGANAIAGGQQPVDVVKLVSVPNTQFKEAVRPVPQLSGQFQVNSHVSVAGYYQFRWDKARLPGVGSYFSSADPAPDGSESLLLGPGVPPALRGPDLEARDSGQGGLQVRVRSDFADYGLYAIRYHAKTPQLVPRLVMTPVGPAPGAYNLAYHEGIKAFGASASKTFGDFNVAIEGSVRDNVDLASSRAGDISAFAPVPPTDNSGNPGYAVGRTAHINISTIGSIGATPLWREANLVGEIAWNRLLKVTKNAAALDPNGTRDGLALRVMLEPVYRGVFDGVDIGIPLGLSWAPKGSRPLSISNPNAWIPDGGGDVSIGLNARYRDAWRFSLSYTHYYGSKATFNDAAQAFTWRQALRDRDFVSASLTYTF
jgi:hypothetical protein